MTRPQPAWANWLGRGLLAAALVAGAGAVTASIASHPGEYPNGRPSAQTSRPQRPTPRPSVPATPSVTPSATPSSPTPSTPIPKPSAPTPGANDECAQLNLSRKVAQDGPATRCPPIDKMTAEPIALASRCREVRAWRSDGIRLVQAGTLQEAAPRCGSPAATPPPGDPPACEHLEVGDPDGKLPKATCRFTSTTLITVLPAEVENLLTPHGWLVVDGENRRVVIK